MRNSKLKTLFSKISDLKYSHVLLMGDFNMKEINWVDMSTTVGEDHIAFLFLETVRDSSSIGMLQNQKELESKIHLKF